MSTSVRFVILAITSLNPFIFGLSSTLAIAASFDCNKSRTASERAICSNQELSALDSKLGRLYNDLYNSVKNPELIKSMQMQWISDRDDFCSTADVIDDKYNSLDIFVKCLYYMTEKRIGVISDNESNYLRKLYYGSRLGMTATISGSSGVNTSNSIIYLTHTRDDAKSFCIEYGFDFSENCITETMNEVRDYYGLPREIRANCLNGDFSSLTHGNIQFRGRANFYDDADADTPKYLFYSAGDLIPGGFVNGYENLVEQYRALCPASISE